MKMVSFMLPSLSNGASSLCAHPDARSLRRPYHNSWALPYVSNRKTAGQNSCSLPNIVLFSISNLIKCCFQFLHTSYPDAFKTAILSIDSVQPFYARTSGRFPACKVRCMVIDQDVHLSQFSVQHGFNKFRLNKIAARWPAKAVAQFYFY